MTSEERKEAKFAKNHPEWNKFVDFAEREGVSLDNPDDWLPWWKCFFAGICAIASQ